MNIRLYKEIESNLSKSFTVTEVGVEGNIEGNVSSAFITISKSSAAMNINN